ncbi:unnamed protein product [Adineta steineri]|uniref:Uncharacterized protein n=1 Tax=Adineta steineri TaxID=433720 RepID=A0A814CUH7_9BILA|nr:unnamed protein product [Adineta steineri]CAF4024627.1 unnamed protein product [Adineta steineri]
MPDDDIYEFMKEISISPELIYDIGRKPFNDSRTAGYKIGTPPSCSITCCTAAVGTCILCLSGNNASVYCRRRSASSTHGFFYRDANCTLDFRGIENFINGGGSIGPGAGSGGAIVNGNIGGTSCVHHAFKKG